MCRHPRLSAWLQALRWRRDGPAPITVVRPAISSAYRGQLAKNGTNASRNCAGCSMCGIWPQSGMTTRLASGMSWAAASDSDRKSPSLAASSGSAYWPSGTTWSSAPTISKRRGRDSVVFVADGLLVDHLEGEGGGARPPRVVRAKGDADEHVGEWLIDVGVGVHEVPRDVHVCHHKCLPVVGDREELDRMGVLVLFEADSQSRERVLETGHLFR
jgi:hypothetical protein